MEINDIYSLRDEKILRCPLFWYFGVEGNEMCFPNFQTILHIFIYKSYNIFIVSEIENDLEQMNRII